MSHQRAVTASALVVAVMVGALAGALTVHLAASRWLVLCVGLALGLLVKPAWKVALFLVLRVELAFGWVTRDDLRRWGKPDVL